MLVRWSWLALLTTACMAHEDPSEGSPVEAPDPEEAEPTDAHRGGVAAMAAEAIANARAEAEAEAEAENAPEPKRNGPLPRTPLTVEDTAEPGPDAALFMRGQQALADGRLDDARALFLQVVRDHPTSPWIPETYLVFGDLYFQGAQLDRAVPFYEKTVQFVDSPAAPWARYRLAWCHMSLGDHARALEQLVATLKMIERAPLPSAYHALAVAVRIDLVLAYAEVGMPAKANAFFEHLAGVGSDEVSVSRQLELLGTRLLELGRKPEAAVICDALRRQHGLRDCVF